MFAYAVKQLSLDTIYLVFRFSNGKLIMQTIFLFLNYPVDKLRELAWSGVPDYMRPTVWRVLLVSMLYDLKEAQ